MADMPDVLSIYPLHLMNPKIFSYPTILGDLAKDLKNDIEIFIDKRTRDIQLIKNIRSKELYSWISDAVEEHGSEMVNKLG
jgi:hypothetical protein